jgi:hypothetical protein
MTTPTPISSQTLNMSVIRPRRPLELWRLCHKSLSNPIKRKDGGPERPVENAGIAFGLQSWFH